MPYIAGARFLVKDKNHEDIIKELIADEEVHTVMVEHRERLGGLHYADKQCWEFFVVIEYAYATIATSENYVCRGGELLGELSRAIINSIELHRGFSTLCDYTEKSEFSFDDTTISFHFFLKVFGRVRVKDIAMEYNSAVYKGTNTTALRAGLVVISGQKRKNNDKVNDKVIGQLLTKAKQKRKRRVTEWKIVKKKITDKLIMLYWRILWSLKMK